MHDDSRKPPSAAGRWWIVILLTGFAAIGHFNRMGISVAGTEVFIKESVVEPLRTSSDDEMVSPTTPAAPLPSKFARAFSETEMGWVYSAFLIVYTIFMLPGGMLIDQIGAAKALALLGLTMGTFVALTGTLGWWLESPSQFWIGLIVIRGFAGMGSAPLHPGAASAVAEVAPIEWRTTANGLVTAGALFGIALGFPLFGRIIDLYSWQWAFVICGGFMIFYAVLWYLFARQLLHHVPHSVHVESKSTQQAAIGRDRSEMLRQSPLYMLTLSYVAYGYFQYLFFYWMGHYFQNVLHVPKEFSRNATFYISIAQGVGMVLGGVFNDQLGRILGAALGRRLIGVSCMGLSALLAGLAVLDHEASTVALLLALAMGSQGMCEGLYWSAATEIGGRARGFAGAFMNTGGNIGGFIAPVLSPLIASNFGWPTAIVFACVVCAGGGLTWLTIGSRDSKFA